MGGHLILNELTNEPKQNMGGHLILNEWSWINKWTYV